MARETVIGVIVMWLDRLPQGWHSILRDKHVQAAVAIHIAASEHNGAFQRRVSIPNQTGWVIEGAFGTPAEHPQAAAIRAEQIRPAIAIKIGSHSSTDG